MRELSAEELTSLKNEGKKLLVDFWAPWCGPCKMLIPRLESLSEKHPDVEFVKVNVDENRDIALDLGIRGVPTVITFNGNELVDRHVGVQPDEKYEESISKL